MYPPVPMLRDRFVPPEELVRITEGSYEQLIERLKVEVAESVDRLFGLKGETTVISTFMQHAVVLHEGGKAVRIRFEKDAKGLPKIVASEAYPLPSYSREESSSFLQKRSVMVVEALFRRDRDTARRYLHEMAPLLTEEAAAPPADVLQSTLEYLEATRPWKTSYEENQGRMLAVLGSRLGTVDQRRLESRFTKLYDGSTPVEDREGYVTLVNADFLNLVERFEKLHETMAGHTTSLETLIVSTDTNEVALGGFGLDFAEDLRQTSRILREAATSIQDVAMKSRVYDVAARALYRYDVAATYITAALGTESNIG